MNRMIVRTAWLSLTVGLLGCTSTEDLGSSPGGSTPLDGTWDITSYEDPLEPSSVTIRGGTLNGSIVVKRAGERCSRTLTFAIEGESMVGVLQAATDCKDGEVTSQLTGRRTKTAPDSATPWNGTYKVSLSGREELTGGELEIAGLSATAGKEWTLTIAGGIATATASRGQYAFVARKR